MARLHWTAASNASSQWRIATSEATSACIRLTSSTPPPPADDSARPHLLGTAWGTCGRGTSGCAGSRGSRGSRGSANLAGLRSIPAAEGGGTSALHTQGEGCCRRLSIPLLANHESSQRPASLLPLLPAQKS